MTSPARPNPADVADKALFEFRNGLKTGHEAVEEIADHYDKLATAAEDSQPVGSEVPDAIRTAVKFMRYAHSILEELPATIDRTNATDRERAENPRNGERNADYDRNKDHV